MGRQRSEWRRPRVREGFVSWIPLKSARLWEGIQGQVVGILTTPPPPSKDVFAALTMQVVARVVMEVRMRAT